MKNIKEPDMLLTQQLVSKQLLFFITLSLIFVLLLEGIMTQRQGVFATLSLACALPLTFYLAIVPIGRINVKRISCVLDPRVWLPLTYVIYFVALPCITIFFDSKYSMYTDEIPQVMLSTLLGIVSLQFGLHILKPLPESIEKVARVDRYAAVMFILFSLITILYYWYWRIQNGFFFTHGAGYIPEANIANGIRDLLGASVTYIPLFIFAVAYRNELWKKRIILYLFVTYAFITIMLYLLSGQIRSLFLLSLMLLASTAHMSQSKKLWRRISIMIPFLLVGTIIFVYTLRYSASLIGESEKPITYILLNLPDIVETGRESASTSDGMKTLPLDRIFMTQEFFFQTVRALNENSSYGYGSYTISNLPIIIPRLLWPGKGIIDDAEALIQQNVLFSNPMDLSLTPLTHFYAEGNIVGILIGFFLVGLTTSFAHKVCFSLKNRIGGLVCWILILDSILQLENNIPVTLLLGIRSGLIFLAFASIVSLFTKKELVKEISK